jgi:hypothetical protein
METSTIYASSESNSCNFNDIGVLIFILHGAP